MTTQTFRQNAALEAFTNDTKLLGFGPLLFSPAVGEMIGLCGYDLVLRRECGKFR